MTNKKTGKSARLIYFTQCNKVSKPPYHHIPLYPNLSQISHPPCLFISLGFKSQSGKLYFNLKAANGQIIGTSMMYADHAAREAAVLHVKGGAAHAGVVEDL